MLVFCNDIQAQQDAYYNIGAYSRCALALPNLCSTCNVVEMLAFCILP